MVNFYLWKFVINSKFSWISVNLCNLWPRESFRGVHFKIYFIHGEITLCLENLSFWHITVLFISKFSSTIVYPVYALKICYFRAVNFKIFLVHGECNPSMLWKWFFWWLYPFLLNSWFEYEYGLLRRNAMQHSFCEPDPLDLDHTWKWKLKRSRGIYVSFN